MKILIIAAAALVLAGCQCGPGKVCKTDDDCAAIGRCSSAGFCVVVEPVVDAGAPNAVLAVTKIDFPAVPCGAPATSQQVDLINAGNAALEFTTSLGNSSSFTVTPMMGKLDPGAMIKLTVTAVVPASATAGMGEQGTLTLTTNDPAKPKLELPVTLKASGVTLTLMPAIALFGVVPVNTQAAPVPVTLTNTGNVPATVTLVAPTDNQFSLGWTAFPAAATVAPGGTLAGLQAGFKPTKTSPTNTAAALTVAEAVCGSSLTSIPMSGQGTNGSVGFSTTDVFFGTNGRVSCGTQATSRTFNIVNTGNAPFSWTGTLGKGAASPFTFAPTSGTVPAQTGSTTITITTTPIPAQASTVDEGFGDILSINTDIANDSSHAIVLHQTASGASLAFAPGAVDFGTVPVNNSANAPFSVINSGNAPATVTLSVDNAKFSLSDAGPGSLGAGITNALTGTFSPGTSVVQELANVSIGTDGGEVLCDPLPAPLTMTGLGTNGSVSYTPAALDFGQVSCGATAAAKVVTFKNDGNQSYTVTPVLAKGTGSAFTIEMSPDSGVVAQDGGTVVITVTPRQVPQTSPVTVNFYGDTLTVSTDVSGDLPHDIALRETAKGAIFAISSPSLNFGSVAVGVTSAAQFTVSNNGNAAGTISFTPNNTTIFGMPANEVINPATPSFESATFSPMAAMPYSDSAPITVSSSTVLCAPLPFTTMALAGDGSASNVIVVSATDVNFGTGGLVPCGTTATAKTVTVTNNSTQSLSFTYPLAKGAGSPFTVSGPATLAASAMGTVTITPKPIPATSSTAPDAFGDTLSIIAMGGPVNETHNVALHETAQGAILALNPTSLEFTSSGTRQFTVNNTGNLAAPYTLTLTGSTSNFSVSPTSATANGPGSVSENVTYSAPLIPGARSASISLATSVARCAPLPAALSVSN